MTGPPFLMDLDLILDNPTGIYHPGELIVGKVVVKVQEEIRLNGKVQIHTCSEDVQAEF